MTSQADVKAIEPVQQVQQQDAKPVVQDNNQETKKVQEQESEASIQEKNWKAFREAREAERKIAEESAKQAKKSQDEATALKAALDAVLNKPQAPQYMQEDEIEETQEQIIDRRVNEAIARREAEAIKLRKEQEQAELPNRIANDFKDFNQVCNQENLDYLEYHYPEVAKAFSHMPQSYEKWSSIYKAVKRFIPNIDSTKDQQKADRNFQKPQSASSQGITNSGTASPAFRLDEKRKEENYRRMQKIMSKID